MLFWVLKSYPEVCDGNQLINPELRNTLHYLNLEKMSSTFEMGQVNFLVTLFKAW